MPEIQIEGEPWLGLVVLADVGGRLFDSPGYYVLARAAEWHSDSATVTAWRGPGYRDEQLPRKHLVEMECQTVLVDPGGFYTCPPILDELKDLVKQKSESLLNDMANERAAEHFSYSDLEHYGDKYGNEVWVKAEVGDAVAVNGETVYGRRRSKPPRNYVKTDLGGRDPEGMEEEIDRDYLAERLAEDLTDELKRPIYKALVDEMLLSLYRNYHGYIMWASDGADIEVWASKRAVRKYEEEQELDAMRRQAAESARRAAEHNRRIEEERRQEAEQREKMKKGGYPTPKDWSPKGRFPWERRGR